MNLETTRQRGRPRNRWQDEVKEDGRQVGGKGWKERVYNRGEWKKLLLTARNRRILHMSMELIITLDYVPSYCYSEFIHKPSKRRVSILLCNLAKCLCEMEIITGWISSNWEHK